MRHNFWSKLYFYMKFLRDVYYSIESMFSEVQYPAWPPLFFTTFCSRCGIEWDKSYSVESGIFFQLVGAVFSDPSWSYRSWVFVDNFIHYAPTILHRVDIWRIWRPACFLYKIWQVSFAPCLGGLGSVWWRPVLDERHVSIGTEQFSFVYCFIPFLRRRRGFTSFSNLLLM